MGVKVCKAAVRVGITFTSCKLLEFPGGPVVKGAGIATAVAQVVAVVGVRSLAREFSHALSVARKTKLLKLIHPGQGHPVVNPHLV